MSKRILLIIFLNIYLITVYSQNAQQNHEKYWYYRYRLVNNFLKVGDCQGCSIPADARGWNDYSTLHFSDGNEWGWYIGILATEYKLLVKNNQNTSETVKELYYALEAFNRVDYYAESYIKDNNGNYGQPWLNGFFISNDVPKNFLGDPNDPGSNYNHFNQQLVESHCKPQFSQPCIINNIESEFYDHNNPIDPDPDVESQDMVTNLLKGLALVNECVPGYVVYSDPNTGVKYFMDGEIRILYEARAIADRVVGWLKDHNWLLHNPVTGKNIDIEHGGNAMLLSYGFAEAACDITDKSKKALALTGFSCLKYHDEITTTIGFETFQAIQNPVLFGVLVAKSNYNDHMFGSLAAISNSWYLGLPTLTPPFWIPSLPPYIPPKNTTNIILSSYFTTKYSRPYLSLLRQVLHGGGNLVPDNTYTDLLNSAPCAGPRNVDGSWPDYDWSVSNRFVDPESRGSNSYDPKGEYNGMDYMLLFNLYCLAQKNYLPAGYTNMMNTFINVNLPALVINNNYIGSHANPLTVEAFGTITAENHIGADGDVTYHAGKEIALLPGFGVDAGADFGAYVQPFHCSASPYGHYIRTTNDTTNPVSEEYNFLPSYVYYADANEKPDNFSEDSYSDDSNTGIYKTDIHNSQINLTPNPTSGYFTLELPEGASNVISIYNDMGQLVFQSVKAERQSAVDLSSQPKGIYFIKVQSGENVFTEKLILQ